LKHKKDAYEVKLYGPGALQMEDRKDAPMKLREVWRDWGEKEEFGPVMVPLRMDELIQKEQERDRAARYVIFCGFSDLPAGEADFGGFFPIDGCVERHPGSRILLDGVRAGERGDVWGNVYPQDRKKANNMKIEIICRFVYMIGCENNMWSICSTSRASIRVHTLLKRAERISTAREALHRVGVRRTLGQILVRRGFLDQSLDLIFSALCFSINVTAYHHVGQHYLIRA
jgi:hypothetical protein